MKVWVDEANTFFYPDITVAYGERDFYKDRQDIVTNPTLFVEVLSKSTEAKDRGEKMLAYRTEESLREYVLVSQTKPIVEQFIKTSDGDWIHKVTIGLKSDVKLDSIGVKLSLEEIYNRIIFKEKTL